MVDLYSDDGSRRPTGIEAKRVLLGWVLSLVAFVAPAAAAKMVPRMNEAASPRARAASSPPPQEFERCLEPMTSGFQQRFNQLRTAFAEHLAGRFPFGEANSQPVDLSSVRKFFAIYGSSLQDLQDQIETKCPEANAVASLAALYQVQIALAPLLTGKEKLAYKVTATFFTDPAVGRGQEQVVAASIDTKASSGASSPPEPASFIWTNGQPITSRFRWAQTAPSVPLESTQSSGRCEPPIGGGVVSVSEMGNWSLLRLAARYAWPLDLPLTEQGIPIVVTVPVCAKFPDVSGADHTPSFVRIVTRLRLETIVRLPGKPDRYTMASIPVFPQSVPPLPFPR